MTDQDNEAPRRPDEIFTIAQGTHTGYPAPGGSGVHQYVDDNGCIWQIHYEPERFMVYRRWTHQPAIEGEFKVVTEWTGEEREAERGDR